MTLGNSELDRIRKKLDTFPPYDWEDDVAALLDAVVWARAERDAHLADYTAELNGGREMRKVLGARDGETLWGCVERTARNTDIMADALMRIASTDDVELIRRITRAAQVKVRGEQ